MTATPAPAGSPEPADPPARRTRAARWRRRGKVLAVVLGAVVVAWLALRDTSPVGHFTSGDAKDRFVAAYDAAMAELPPPDETLDVRTGYGVVRLYRFDTTGGGEPGAAPLVLLPGRSSGSPLWADNLPSLRAISTVYTVDLLGEPGLSVQDRPIGSDAEQAEWLAQALDALPHEQVHVVGVSIGGWTAVNLALHEPDGLASLTLLDPVQVFAGLSGEAVVRSVPASVPWFPKSWRDSFASWTAGGAPVEDEPVAAMIEAGMQTYRIVLPAPSRVAEDELARLDLPVLAILAEESVMHDAAAAAAVAERTLVDGRVEVYEGASHAVNGEEPERIARDVARLVDRAEAAGDDG